VRFTVRAVLHRAYALLEVKTVDVELRAIDGIATTPTADRMGDVIEPKGATFANPLPLLLYHNAKAPVGTVMLDAADAAGIRFRASLPVIADAGTLRERVNEAWQSIKAGLIRGVSIGFRPLEDGIEFIKGGGLRFTKIEILELSLVAIPANAEARIETIKAIDAASYFQRRTPTMTPAMTTLEQIQSYTSMREAKSARMRDLMAAAATAGVTLDEAQSAEYDSAEAEVAGLGKHIERLGALEASNRAAALPANGSSRDAAAESRSAAAASHPAIFIRHNLEPGIEFTRMVMCKLVAFQNQFSISPLAVAKARYPDNQRIHQYLERAAVPAGTTTDANWAGNLVDQTNLTQEFLAWLRPQTIIGKFGTGGIPSLRTAPFNVGIVGQTSGGAGYWVGQGKAKPLTKFSFDRQALGMSKVAAIAVITDELARASSPSAEQLVRDGLRDACVERLDIDFVDPAKAEVANVSPASITNGVTALVSTAGSTADSIRADLALLLQSFVASNQNVEDLVLLLPNTLALTLSLLTNAMGVPEFPAMTLRGGTLVGIPAIASQYVRTAAAGDMVIAVNARSIGLADDGAVSVEASREASLEMSDAPTGDAGAATPVATTLVSMWQTNSLALKAERFINWKKLRSGAVVYMSHVDWAGGS
jgi:HK97 family phage major capsid protein/HK97 family phage prohead protease